MPDTAPQASVPLDAAIISSGVSNPSALSARRIVSRKVCRLSRARSLMARSTERGSMIASCRSASSGGPRRGFRRSCGATVAPPAIAGRRR